MANVREIVGLNKLVGCCGIEIETEAPAQYRVPEIEGWRAVNDGSLRDFGKEYITVGAVPKAELGASLARWKDGLGAIHGRLRRDSVSTSVHVHMNVLELTPMQVLNFYLCGILFENVMARFAGPDRIGNLFCLRTVDAEDQFNLIKQSVKQAGSEQDLLFSFNPNNYKYSNINTVPITNSGSLEFRVMRGTTDIDEIRVWSEVLCDIREFAKQFDNPIGIIRKMREVGADGLLASVFGANADVFKYVNYEKDILKNFIYVADMATVRKDWNLRVSEKKKVSSGIDFAALAGQANPNARARLVPAAPPQPAVMWDEDFEQEDM